MNKLWKDFQRLSVDCYTHMISNNPDRTVWNQAFDTLVGAIKGERDKNPDFGKEFYQVDETTDFEYGVEDWLLDYLDELGAGGLHEKRCQVCDTIIGLFAWKEQSPADFMFEKSSALSAMGRLDEAVALCEKWYQDEPESQLSAAALIYARINAEDYAGAEQIVEKYVSKGDKCTDDTELVYRAAVRLYEAKGDEKTAEQMKKTLEKYDDEIERELIEEFEELPFGDGFGDFFDEDFDDEDFDDEDFDDEDFDDEDFEDEDSEDEDFDVLPFQ